LTFRILVLLCLGVLPGPQLNRQNHSLMVNRLSTRGPTAFSRTGELKILKQFPGGAAQGGYDRYVKHVLQGNLFFRAGRQGQYDLDNIRQYQPRNTLFWLIFLVLLLLAIIRIIFYKYFSDLFRAFANPTLSQRQLRDQLSQTPFPALLLNIFFSISLGLYLFLLLRNSGFITNYNIYLLIPSFVALIGTIYFIKYFVLRLSGWLFGASDLTDGYIYILYLINKVLGIVLVPFLVILAFCSPQLASAGYYISIIIISLFIVYRYFRAYHLIKSHISFSRFHFFLYLCAFEIVPVLIVGKVVLVWLNGNA